MPRYDQLRTLAFRLASDVTPLPYQLATLAFPEAWKPLLYTLQADATGRQGQANSVPITTLNSALRALVPDLVSINRYASQRGERPWLQATTPVNPQALFLIIHAWVRTAFAAAADGLRRETLAAMRPEQLRWTTATIDLAAWGTAPNGSAEPHAGGFAHAVFGLLPDFVGAELSRATLTYGSTPLRFRRAPVAPGASGTELISWPPQWYEDARGRWPYSVVMTLTTQTVPFQPFPVLHCDLGIRRWAGPRVWLPGGGTSVYLLTDVPWLPGLAHSTSFQVAPLRKTYQDSGQGHPTYTPVWGSFLTPLLDALQPQRRFPAPEALIADPAASLTGSNGPTAAIVYRSETKPLHGVGRGLGPADRRQLTEQIADILQPAFVFTDPPQRVRVRVTKPDNPFFTKEDAERSGAVAAERRAVVRASIGPGLTIELWHQTTAVRTALIQTVCSHFGVPEPPELPYTWATPELMLTLRAQPLGALGEELASAPGGTKRDRRQGAIRRRIADVGARVPREGGVIAALVELPNASQFTPETDPKAALRLGFAHVDRVTQFIDTEDNGSLGNRAQAAVLDLLRQVGVQTVPRLAVKHAALPEALQYVGLWLIKQYASSSATRTQQLLPVLVRLASDTGAVYANAPGIDTWLPYPQALLAIAQGRARGFARPQLAMPFIRQTLQRDVQGDTLLLCHAQNLRSAWPWLGNGKLLRDQLAFGDEAPQPISRWPALRVVRVRDASGHETPEWYAVQEDEEGFAKGLFQSSERVFASTHAKPHQFKKLSRSLSKATTWQSQSGKVSPPRPDVDAWNAGLFELTVAGLQPEDAEAWPWAALAHELRDQGIHYDQATALPLPLHLAAGMEEYVLPMDEGEDG